MYFIILLIRTNEDFTGRMEVEEKRKVNVDRSYFVFQEATSPVAWTMISLVPVMMSGDGLTPA